MDDEERINEEEAAEMYAQYRSWLSSFEDERDIEPHKRSGYFEMQCEMADLRRKELKEQIR